MLQESLRLKECGFEVTIAHTTFSTEKYLVKGAQRNGVAIVRLDIPPFLRQWKGRQLHFLRYFIKKLSIRGFKNFDLVHIFMPWSNAGLEHITFFSQLGLPLVVSAHNAFPCGSSTPWHTHFLAPAFENVVGVYGVSESSLACFEGAFRRFLREKTIRRVIFNSVDISQFVANPAAYRNLRKEIGISESTPIVGCVGRISDHKRPIYTLEVFSKVSQKFPDAHFLFVGEGSLENKLRREIKLKGLENRVTVVPFTERPETIFPALDVHVLLSKVEGFGISTVEAMSCEVPVVGTDVPGTNEVIKHGTTGYLVSKDDEADAVATICELLADSRVRKRLGKAGRKDCEDRFSYGVWKINVGQFYKDVFISTQRYQ